MKTTVWAIFRIRNEEWERVNKVTCNEESIVGVCPSLDYAEAYMNYNQDKLKDGETYIALEVDEL